jgi:hypothetical protein
MSNGLSALGVTCPFLFVMRNKDEGKVMEKDSEKRSKASV